MAVSIDDGLCLGCGCCIDVCSQGALELNDNDKTVVNADDCTECGSCIDMCPVEAIKI